MPLTQGQAALLTQDMLLRGVIETMITESAVLRYLPFLTVTGSAVDYNQELTLPTSQWHAINDTWTESTGTYVQKTAKLKILGGNADVDAFTQRTYANKNDIAATIVQSKAKATAYAFNDSFYNGDSGNDPNQFDGLPVLAGAPVLGYANIDATHRAFVTAANGALLDLATMDQLVDMVKPGKPDVLFMSKRSRRKLNTLRRASGNLLEVGVNAFGQRALYYDGIPIEVDENIGDTEVQGSSGNVCSSIYAVKFGAQTGICGLENGGIAVEPIGPLETKDAIRWRIKWYCGLAAFRSIAFCLLRGVKDS